MWQIGQVASGSIERLSRERWFFDTQKTPLEWRLIARGRSGSGGTRFELFLYILITKINILRLTKSVYSAKKRAIAKKGEEALMYEAAYLAAVFLAVIGAVHYVYQTWYGNAKPVLVTWILMNVMMDISFFMYFMSPNRSWTANIGVTAGVVNLAIILIGVGVKKWKDDQLSVEFDPFKLGCLIAGLSLVPLWAVTGNPLLSYTLVQVIALIAYIATIAKLVKLLRLPVEQLRTVKMGGEPWFLWWTVFFANLIAIYPAWVKQDIYSAIYLGRAVPSTALVIFMVWLADRRVARCQET